MSITRLKLRRLRFLIPFGVLTLRTRAQLRRSPGFLCGYLATGPGRTFWTMTLWSDEESMRDFRQTGVHLKAMPRLLDWCDEAAVATLTTFAEAPPEPAAAAAMLRASGRLSKVCNPSWAHGAGELWPDGNVPRRTPILQPLKA